MNKFIESLKNIWSIKELRNRILFTLLLLAIYRWGTYIVLPGVNSAAIESAASNRGTNDILGLINAFTGGAFGKASIFALGIMPYITASIIIQLMGFAVPYFQRLQQREGESGRKKITQITRFLTVLITLVQGGGYLATYVAGTPGAIDPTINQSVFYLGNTIILMTGTIFAMWLGEKITDSGIGNGISLLIMVGIIARLPSSLIAEFQTQLNGGGLFTFILEMAGMFIVVMGTIMVVQGVRRIPIQFAKRMVGRSGQKMPLAGARDFIPLKVNAAGVMPIIFAQALMFLPLTVTNWLSSGNATASSDFLLSLSNWKSLPYNILFFLLIVLFTFVYTALLVNPQQYSEYLKRQNAFIPGVKPGLDTQEYIDNLTTKVTLPGSIFLGIISILPAIASIFGVNDGFALFFGGTSLLIMVGVVIDTLQQVDTYLLMQKYDGIVKSGDTGKPSGMASLASGM